jgi:hypothetical protein
MLYLSIVYQIQHERWSHGHIQRLQTCIYGDSFDVLDACDHKELSFSDEEDRGAGYIG